MNNTITNKTLWEEKNSIEVNQNLNNNENDTTAHITKNMENTSEKKECGNTGKKYIRICNNCNRTIELQMGSWYDSFKRYPDYICKACRKQLTINQQPKRETLSKKCPLCNKLQTYHDISALNFAIKHKCKCYTCDRKRYKLIRDTERYIKQCPVCNKELKYANRTSMKRSIRENNVCKECIKFVKKYNPKYNPNYNDDACEFMDDLNIKNNWNLKHARNNGAEEMILWYYPDGYDKQLNIVFEYDEPHHYYRDGTLKPKDIRRQLEIINYTNCRFFRYNEKMNILYEVTKSGDNIINDGDCKIY